MAVELAIKQEDCRRNRFQFLLRWIVVGTQQHIGLFYHLQLYLYSVFAPVCAYRTTKEKNRVI